MSPSANKIEHFATLFDRTFLPQGLALMYSLKRRVKHYKLWIICMDEDSFLFLSPKALPFIECLRISELETEELKAVKKTRSKGEYCWTVTPFVPRFVFHQDRSISRVTYIDSDLWFLQDPTPIFQEFHNSGKSVMITEHAYAPEYDMSKKFGKFCVQFIIFEKDGSQEVTKWWEEKCLEWCYNRLENGKFGDQMYLNDFEDLFPDKVHILQAKEYTLAPWNASHYNFKKSLFFHFHSVRLLSDIKIHLGVYQLPKIVFDQIYLPYFNDLIHAIDEMKKEGVLVVNQVSLSFVIKTAIKRLKFLFTLRSCKLIMTEKMVRL